MGPVREWRDRSDKRPPDSLPKEEGPQVDQKG
jgi:hypothetical protein